MLQHEIEVKDKIITKRNKESKALQESITDLKYKLSIPRRHMDYLETKGKLDEFVDAKKSGQDPTAKWCLLDAAKDQLDRI